MLLEEIFRGEPTKARWAALGRYLRSQKITGGTGIRVSRDAVQGTMVSAVPPKNFPRQARHAFELGKATPPVEEGPANDKVIVAPGTISSIEATIDSVTLSTLDEAGFPPMLTLSAGRHVIALKIEWEPIAYDINEDVEGLDPYYILGAGGSCVAVEVVHETEENWPTTLDEDTVWPEADSATGDVTNGIFFQRLGLVEIESSGGRLVARLGDPVNDGLKSSANGSFCPPQSFTLIPLP